MGVQYMADNQEAQEILQLENIQLYLFMGVIVYLIFFIKTLKPYFIYILTLNLA